MFQSRCFCASGGRPAVLGERHRSLRRVVLAVVLAGGLAAVGWFAPAASASPPTVTCGDTISVPGTYLLSGDCTGGIKITSSDVTLKLGGHTITSGALRGAAFGVLVGDSAGAISGVAIKGPGTLTGFGAGVGLGVPRGQGVSGSTVSGVTVTRNADGMLLRPSASGDTVIDNTVTSNVVGIVLLPGATGDTVNHNTARDNLTAGIQLDSGATGNTLTNNTALNNNTAGFGFDDLSDGNSGCDSNTWRHNTFNTANQTCIR